MDIDVRDGVLGNKSCDSVTFQQELKQMVEDLQKGGWLMVFRNKIPVALLSDRMLGRRAKAVHHSDVLIKSYFDGLRDRGSKIRASENSDRVLVVIPRCVCEWFVKETSPISTRAETTGYGVPDKEFLQTTLAEFCDQWRKHDGLRLFDPNNEPLGTKEIAAQVRAHLKVPPPFPIANVLPDLWISMAKDMVREIVGIGADARKRTDVEEAFVGFAAQLARWVANKEGKREDASDESLVAHLARFLSSEQLRVVRVSGAEFNQRYMGERVRREIDVAKRLVHAGLGYVYSRDSKSWCCK